MMANLTGVERELYRKGREAFNRVSSVQGDRYISNSEAGLGPAFNADSCASCHAYPTPGGSSPRENPQLEIAKREGALNVIPRFLTKHGPVLQSRFKRDQAGFPDGSVHSLFTIAGRRDAPGCDMPQPEFEREYREGNLSFRIATPLYGIGLIEAIPDDVIEANAQRSIAIKKALGIAGHPNRNPQDGTIARLGWKAQTSSLELFAAEAYAVEQGVTNELFPQERLHPPASCIFNATPEDQFLPLFRNSVDATSNVYRVAYFTRFLAPSIGADESKSGTAGSALFERVGCGQCHTPALESRSSHPALDHRRVNLYSDLLLHRMGSQLADGIQQGSAEPDEFRTAPLWGVGQRLFFLHDGRTNDLNDSVLLHASPAGPNRSEANMVIDNYRRLSEEERQILLSFLRSL